LVAGAAAKVSWWVELAVKPGQLANLEKLTGQMVESTRNETGVLAYQRFVSDDRQIVHVYERYENSAAAITHLEKFARLSASATRAWWTGDGSRCSEIRAASCEIFWTDTGPRITNRLASSRIGDDPAALTSWSLAAHLRRVCIYKEVEQREMSPLFGLFGFALLAVGAGVSFVVQQAVNADLRSTLGSAAWAGFISYLGGTLCMLALAVALRHALPPAAAVLRTNWWAWSGGFFGAIYIAISILLVPRLGAATFVALLIAGQMVASLLFDNYGWFGLAERPADPLRIFGALLLVGGVILIRH
jgi:transporter family-2 protein